MTESSVFFVGHKKDVSKLWKTKIFSIPAVWDKEKKNIGWIWRKNIVQMRTHNEVF